MLNWLLPTASFARPSEISTQCRDVLQIFAEIDATFLGTLSGAVVTRRRNHIAHTSREVYPDRPDLGVRARPLPGGWYIGTNISNREKLRILKAACKVCRLEFGNDLKFVSSEWR